MWWANNKGWGGRLLLEQSAFGKVDEPKRAILFRLLSNRGVAFGASDVSDVEATQPSHPLHAVQWQ